MKLVANNIVLKILGLLLLTGAVLKGYELLTTPTANTDIWSNRYFLIFVVEFELSLGIWLLSGLFKRAAWLVTLGCFSLFCCITLYKGLTGAASCGCFGNVHVNPWITLFVIDLPAVLLLMIFRPNLEKHRILNILHWLEPMPKFAVFGIVFLIGLTSVAVSSPVLILNEPETATSTYEVLEPSKWIGKELPILGHIDIANQLKNGNWLAVLYHHDCPDCQKAINQLERLTANFSSNEAFLRIALIEVPPYKVINNDSINKNSPCIIGKLDFTKKWFVTTPVIVLLSNHSVVKVWQENVPIFEELLKYSEKPKESVTFETSLSQNRKGGGFRKG